MNAKVFTMLLKLNWGLTDMNIELIKANQSAMKIRRINRNPKLSFRMRLAAIAAVSTARKFEVSLPYGVESWQGYWQGYKARSVKLHAMAIDYV